MGIVTQKAIFLDRDGVLNLLVNGRPPSLISSVVIPEDVLPGLLRLRKAGYLTIGITNQPDISRQGPIRRFLVEYVNEYLCKALPLDKMYMCPHDDADACACRKPKPGMLMQAAKDFGIDPLCSYMIGDREKDIIAGKNAGCKTLLMTRSGVPVNAEADITVSNMKEAADWILGWEERNENKG